MGIANREIKTNINSTIQLIQKDIALNFTMIPDLKY